MTHMTAHCPIETDSAVSRKEEDGSLTTWVSSQYPHGQQRIIADRVKKKPDDIHVIGMPVGGGYGGKISNAVAKDTSALAETVDVPVKVIYSRENQFIQYSRVKDIVIVDLKTAVDKAGKLLAREVDIHQDEGLGISKIYECDHSRVSHYHSEVPVRHAVIRGTSYIQGVFALESHMDEIARKLKIDPLDFRIKNVRLEAHGHLLRRAADMILYGQDLPKDTGIGMALVNHGSEELGAVFSRVSVDRRTGEVTVEKICGAFDIGKVMNIRTCRMGAEGAFVWGVGYALHEQVEADGHQIHTKSMWNYEVPRFQHVPEMELEFMEVHPQYGGPRGVGEMPMVPVTPSIANAIRDAVGIRLYQTPFTPDRVLAALKQKG
jgi:nicotinate dehydrogenase subunit B